MPERVRTGLRFAFATLLIGPATFTAMGLALSGFTEDMHTMVFSHLETTVHFACYILVFFPVIAWARMRSPYPLLVRFAGVVTLSAVATFLAVLLVRGTGLDHDEILPKLQRTVLYGLVLTPVLLLMEQIWDGLGQARREVERRALAEEQERRTAAEARWTSLESRMQPHFLFNTLTSIRELLHRDPQRADLMIQRFAELLRFSLDAPQQPLLLLAEELRMVKGYLEIEKMRLDARLSWSVEADPAAMNLRVPSMSLLTLVENAIKHSISVRRGGGRVSVTVHREGPSLRLSVADDGRGFDGQSFPVGRGLDLLRERLQLLYGEQASLKVQRHPAGVIVEVRMPVPSLESTPDAQTSLLRG